MLVKKIIYYAFMFLSFTVLFSCIKKDDEPADNETYINAEITGYVREFKAAAIARNIPVGKIKIAFEPTGTFTTYGGTPRTIGICLSSSKQVYLAESAMSGGYSVTEKKWLVFHELGHCYAGRKHNDTNITKLDYHGQEFDAPASIMTSRMIDVQAYMGYPMKDFIDLNWNSYLNELFYNDLSYMAGFGPFHFATGSSKAQKSQTKNMIEILVDDDCIK